MKKILFALSFIIHAVAASAAENANPLQKHSIELNFSPDLNYYMFANHKDAAQSFRKFERQNEYPFIGFNLGISYIYRPTKYLGVSVGLNNQLFSLHQHSDLTFITGPNGGGEEAGRLNAYNYTGLITFPLLIHLTAPVKNHMVEFATGPEFCIPYYYVFHEQLSSNDPNILTPSTDKSSSFYSHSDIKRDAAFGWNFQLGTHIFFPKSFSMFIGPEFKIINALYFEKRSYPDSESRVIDFSLGLKLGFRFGLSRHSS